MANKKDQIKLLENLHRSYSQTLSEEHPEETKEKVKNLLQMIDAVINSLRKKKDETRLQKIASRLKQKYTR